MSYLALIAYEIIDRYIIRKFLGTFLYSIALLSVVIIIFDLSEKLMTFLKKRRH